MARVLLCPDSWGGFASAETVAKAMAEVLERHGLTATVFPLADGGEGTADVLRHHAGATPHGSVAEHRLPQVSTPAGPCSAILLQVHHGESALLFLESAQILDDGRALQASTTKPRDPHAASSFGLGQALRHACATGRPLTVGLGGSATTDGGVGLAMGLGLRALDEDGRTLPPRGDALLRVATLEGPVPPIAGRVRAWADVDTLARDAARVFGPQKGLMTHELDRWTDALERWAQVLADWRSRHRLPAVDAVAGGGAAGGVGLALHALLDAPILSGARAVSAHLGLPAALAEHDLAVTGEGRLDATSFAGKVVGEVVRLAGEVPVWAVVATTRGPIPPTLTRVVVGPPDVPPGETFSGALEGLEAAILAATQHSA